MSARDERPAGRAPAWAWTALELMPPDEGDNEALALLLDHKADLECVIGRLAYWDAEALTLPVDRRAGYWVTKADALAMLHDADYVTWDILQEDPLDVGETLRARAKSAAHTAALVSADVDVSADTSDGWPAWVRLAEPSRLNDKWGPLIPLLDFAMTTVRDERNDSLLRRWAEVCRAHDEAREYCRARGIDTEVTMPVHPTTLPRLKGQAFAHRGVRLSKPQKD